MSEQSLLTGDEAQVAGGGWCSISAKSDIATASSGLLSSGCP